MSIDPLPRLKRSMPLTIGQRGEMIGWGYLVKKGYQILEKNYRCPLGEIDVIAQKDKGRRLAFIEIKTRSSHRFGYPEEAVHASKQRKLIRLAQWYLKEKKWGDIAVTFEVLAIDWKGPADPEIRLIENAFSANGDIA
ncbi:MAG: YraN family protein [Candidatus Omnitrophica bacterium]|nr:YraN family protein [Candidatus Omnitrophota bacterium]